MGWLTLIVLAGAVFGALQGDRRHIPYAIADGSGPSAIVPLPARIDSTWAS